MQRKNLPAICIVFVVLIVSCSKKHLPERVDPMPAKTVVKKVPVPVVITVNDSVAQKSVDGRLYYDLLGRRYWKNYNNGKYYLFNKSMYTNPAFKPH